MNRVRTVTFALYAVLATAGGNGTGTLRVIGAGYGRTGTDSLKHALDMLGQGPTYHMIELLGLSDTQARPITLLEMLGFVDGHNDLWAQ